MTSNAGDISRTLTMIVLVCGAETMTKTAGAYLFVRQTNANWYDITESIYSTWFTVTYGSQTNSWCEINLYQVYSDSACTSAKTDSSSTIYAYNTLSGDVEKNSIRVASTSGFALTTVYFLAKTKG